MDENQNKQDNLIDTTDCLEAIGVFRGWKNFLFVIVILSLLLLQVSFWLVDTGYVEISGEAQIGSSAAAVEDTERINAAAKQVAAQEPNQPAPAAATKQKKIGTLAGSIKFEQLAWLIRFLNFVLIPAAVLYCLTMLFALKVSMLGRLGGINHISRAFFLSLVMLVLLLPWQKFFSGVISGAMYTPAELSSRCAAAKTQGVFGTALFYLRFSGYWVVVVLLAAFSQLRSCRWAKAILRRLEVI